MRDKSGGLGNVYGHIQGVELRVYEVLSTVQRAEDRIRWYMKTHSKVDK